MFIKTLFVISSLIISGYTYAQDFENQDIDAPWNDILKNEDPLAPWNNPLYEDDPLAPWNDPVSDKKDTNKYLNSIHERDGDYYWK